MAGYQAKFPGLGRGLREVKQGPCGGSEVCPGTRQNFPGLGRGLREVKQGPCEGSEVCLVQE